jgi:hypothetical protein
MTWPFKKTSKEKNHPTGRESSQKSRAKKATGRGGVEKRGTRSGVGANRGNRYFEQPARRVALAPNHQKSLSLKQQSVMFNKPFPLIIVNAFSHPKNIGGG